MGATEMKTKHTATMKVHILNSQIPVFHNILYVHNHPYVILGTFAFAL